MVVKADEEHVTEAVWLTVITEPVVIGETFKTGAVDVDTDATIEAVADEEDVFTETGAAWAAWCLAAR